MPTLAEIQALLTETQTSLDAEQAAVKDLNDQKDAAIAALEQQIIDLKAIIDAGGADPAGLQAIFDGITAIKADLETTV